MFFLRSQFIADLVRQIFKAKIVQRISENLFVNNITEEFHNFSLFRKFQNSKYTIKYCNDIRRKFPVIIPFPDSSLHKFITFLYFLNFSI